ncbi:hypothetical protein [Rathayibacter soli]|uniref:hypothetical protein n=1 Tax=Rathayibacter soli TaxID=3144168 RepID=UPI0027E40503|nr:hypothetical protein [Glaciibacter superstes]
MIMRRAFYYWQFIAAVVLPVWLLVGWAVFGAGGAGLFGLVLVCPIAFIALLAIALLNYARTSVRRARAVSWRDAGILAAWHLSIIGVGFFGPGGAWFAFAAIILAIFAFWYALWALVTDAGRRVAAAFAPVAGEPGPSANLGPQGSFAQDATVIIVQEKPADGTGPAAR